MVGTDVLQLIIGLPLWIIGFILFAWSYRRTCVTQSYISKETREGLKVTKEYNVKEPTTDQLNWSRGVHLIGFLIFTIIMAVAVLT